MSIPYLTRRLLSVQDTRLMLGSIGRTKLYDLIKVGEIRAVKLGRRTLFDEADLLAYMQRLPDAKHHI